MKAIIVTPGKENSARLTDLSKPQITDQDVFVKTLKVGLDGTDREINKAEYGTAPRGEDFLIIGHEALGEIQKIGHEVSSKNQFQVGDLVVPLVRKPDDCHYCQAGEPDMCIKGEYKEHGIKEEHGFLREFFCFDPDYLVKIPRKLKDVAVLLEPLSVVEKGVRQGFKIQERMTWDPKTALVLGLGPIGILGAFVLRLRNLNVWLYSIEAEDNPKVELIRRMGIKYISAKEIELEELPTSINQNIDFILEATGNSIVAINAMSLVGQNGILCLTGVTGGHKKVTICADCLNLDLVLGNKLIYGTVNANKLDFESGVEDMNKIHDKFPKLLENLISHEFDLEDFKKGLKDFHGTKAIINFTKKSKE